MSGSFRWTLSVLFCTLITFLDAPGQVKVGADVLVEERMDIVVGRRIGLITNQTGRLSNGQFLVDALLARGITVAALFGPEHGIRGDAGPGERILDTVDATTGIPVYSLYGSNRKPTTHMLQGIDLLLYDIQDVGARFYTYISTLGLTMEAAGEMGIPFVILDRPNPLGATVDGPLMEDSLRSFVGMYPIPVVYGLTCGELGVMINESGWLVGGIRCSLTVIAMKGWGREMKWGETGLVWVAPSPNIPKESSARVYPATCLFEATNISEGRGTDRPFEQVGAPFLNTDTVLRNLKGFDLPGVRFRECTFTPRSSKFKGIECHGIELEVTDPSLFKPVHSGIILMHAIYTSHPGLVKIDQRRFGRLLGNHLADRMGDGEALMEIGRQWSLEWDLTKAGKFLIYE